MESVIVEFMIIRGIQGELEDGDVNILDVTMIFVDHVFNTLSISIP